MVDPVHITNFKLNDDELEEVLLFWVLVAGKTAKTTSMLLESLMRSMTNWCGGKRMSPFKMIRMIDNKLPKNWLSAMMKEIGIGCYKNKSRAFLELAHSGLDLRTCTVDDLEKIHGIGMKTSRCFIMHSRRNCKHAGLDVHILRYLKDLGYDVPTQTPSSKKKYLNIEKQFIELAQKSSMNIADFDLKIWREYSGN